jgi:alginate O-acetyltransferase complex protein AlgI
MGFILPFLIVIVISVLAAINWHKYSPGRKTFIKILLGAHLFICALVLGFFINISLNSQGAPQNSFAQYMKSIFGFDPGSPLLFTEFYFWAFFLLVMVGFSLVHKRRLMRSVFLMAIGLFFYWKTSGFFVVLLIFSTIFDFNVGRWMEKTETNWKRTLLLTLSIIVNLGMLVYFKYAYFFTDSYNAIFVSPDHPEQKMHVVNWFAMASNYITDFFQWKTGATGVATHFKIDVILLPVGVSFFTFQTISYAVDVYRRNLKAVQNIFDFGFFVTYFPQLVAGPIVRATDFIPQIYKEHKITKYEFGLAIFWILNGLIKKLVLSDYLASNYIDRVFDSPEIYGGLGNILALFLYSLQVYADFSGYTDIAIGVSLLIGFRLPMNFNSPYKSKNVGEFWKRWHMSLSKWLQDYLYIPLGGNKKASFGSFFWLIVIAAFILVMPGTFKFLNSYATLYLTLVVLYFTLFVGLLPKIFKAIGGVLLIGIFILKLILNFVGVDVLDPILGFSLMPWYVVLIITVAGNIVFSLFSANRRKAIINNINLMLTMVIGGLWHGASWNFLIWGALNGAGLVVYKAWKKISPYENSNFFLVNAWKIMFTFVFISFTRLFFRAGDIKNTNGGMETVNRMWKQITTGWTWTLENYMTLFTGYWKIWLVFILGMIIHWLPVKVKDWYRTTFATAPMFAQIAGVVIVVFLVYQSITAGLQTFIYFQF